MVDLCGDDQWSTHDLRPCAEPRRALKYKGARGQGQLSGWAGLVGRGGGRRAVCRGEAGQEAEAV
jgi:hypothetical protein